MVEMLLSLGFDKLYTAQAVRCSYLDFSQPFPYPSTSIHSLIQPIASGGLYRYRHLTPGCPEDGFAKTRGYNRPHLWCLHALVSNRIGAITSPSGEGTDSRKRVTRVFHCQGCVPRQAKKQKNPGGSSFYALFKMDPISRRFR